MEKDKLACFRRHGSPAVFVACDLSTGETMTRLTGEVLQRGCLQRIGRDSETSGPVIPPQTPSELPKSAHSMRDSPGKARIVGIGSPWF